MALMQRANALLRVKDDQVDRLLNEGYNLIDDAGHIVKKGKPISVEDYKRAYAELTKENEELKAKLASYETSDVAQPEKKRRTRKSEPTE